MGKREKQKLKREIKDLARQIEGENAVRAIKRLKRLANAYGTPGANPHEIKQMIATHLDRTVRKSRSDDARRRALDLLIEMRQLDDASLAQLLERNASAKVKSRALRELQAKGWYEQTTLERLLTADLDTDVRYTALSMLHLGGWFDKSTLTVMLDDPSESIQAAALRMLVEHDRAYLDRTVRLLEGDEGPLRRVALELLRDFGSEEHVDALVRASLRYEPHYPAGMVWCQNAVRALASIGGAEARRALSRLLCTAHAKVARVALEELQSMGGPLEEILIDVLKSDDEADHRSAAAVNLDGAVSASVRAALVAALVGDEASDVRMACARSLAAGGPGQDVSVLIDAARREGDDRVRAAILDVVSLGDRSVLPDVRAILEDAPDTAGDRWLAALGDPDATVRILDRLYDAPRTSSGTYQAVFKDYAEAVCGVARYSGGVGLRPSYDQSQSRKAIAWLCGVDTPASSNVLHHAARLPDTSVVSGFVEVPYDHAHPTGTETHTKTLSFAYVRDAAVAELTERGNPPYDQSVYAKTGCWVLPEVYRGE